ncbi:hypothetical protein Tco_1215209 [Tanacetum coccineum]
MASQDARLSKFEDNFKQQQSEMTNKIDTVLKAITDRMAGALPSDTVKNPKLNVNSTFLVLYARSYLTIDPQCSSHPSPSINVVKTCSKEVSHSQTSLLQTGMGIGTQQTEEPKTTLEDEFQDLHLNLPVLEMEDPGLFTLPCILGDSKPFDTLADLGSCVNIIPLCLFKKLNIRLLEEIDHIFKLPEETKSYPLGITPSRPRRLLSKIAGKRKGALSVVFEKVSKRSRFREWEIARDAEINPFKHVLVFRRMVEFLRAIPINLKRNMWESEDLIDNLINWDKPPKTEIEHGMPRLD